MSIQTFYDNVLKPASEAVAHLSQQAASQVRQIDVSGALEQTKGALATTAAKVQQVTSLVIEAGSEVITAVSDLAAPPTEDTSDSTKKQEEEDWVLVTGQSVESQAHH